MHLFFSVGEPSGDHHAAAVIAELKRRHPHVRCTGYGGPRMEAAGLESDFRLTDMAVMGVAAVLPLLRKFFALKRRAAELLAERRPDAVVLVDFPGFNGALAGEAKKLGIPVIYYMPPQFWAWGAWRLRRFRKKVDRVLCGLPFEADWYRDRGVPTTLVGHPFFEDVAEHRLDAEAVAGMTSAGRVVGLLPGSRRGEVEKNWPVMLDAVRRLHWRHPDVSFRVACYSETIRDRCGEVLATKGPDLPVTLELGKTPEVIAAADCCLSVSGSVSLELLARTTPAVMTYRGDKLTGFLARRLVTCPFISLPNLVAGEEVLPEFPSDGPTEGHAHDLAVALDRWLTDPIALTVRRDRLAEVAAEVAAVGATDNVCDAIEAELGIGRGEARVAA